MSDRDWIYETQAIEAIAKELAAYHGVDWDTADEHERRPWITTATNVLRREL